MYLVFYPLMNEHSSFQCYNNIYCNSIIYIFLLNVVNASRTEIGRCLCSAREHTICGKSISNTLACGSCAFFFLFLPHFDVICARSVFEQKRQHVKDKPSKHYVGITVSDRLLWMNASWLFFTRHITEPFHPRPYVK